MGRNTHTNSNKMAEQLKWRVVGNWSGNSIDETMLAYSDKQAKLRVGMRNGIGGKELGEFQRSNSIRVVRVR